MGVGAIALVAGLGLWLLVPGATIGPQEPGAGAGALVVRAEAARASAPILALDADAAARPGAPLDAELAGGSEAPAASRDPADPGVRLTLDVSGLVVDDNAMPVVGAEVLLIAASADNVPTLSWPDAPLLPLDPDSVPHALTGPDGRFKISPRQEPARPGAVPSAEVLDTTLAQSLLLVLRRAGFAVRVLPCQPDDSRATRVDVGTIVLNPGSVATLRVLDEVGAPLAGAVLQLSLDGSHPFDPLTGRRVLERRALLGSSDSEGRMLIDGFPAGVAELDCLLADFVPVALSASFTAGLTTDLGDVTLRRGDAISGAVTDRDGLPLADASVLVRVAELARCAPDADPVLSNLLLRSFVRGSHDLRTRTDEHGRFHAATLDHPFYAVFADAPGHEPVCADAVPVGTSDLQLVLDREALLILSLVDRATGLPVPDVQATAQRSRPTDDGTILSYGPYLPVLTGRAAAEAAGGPASHVDADGAGLLVVERPGAEGTQVHVTAAGYATAHVVLPGVDPPDRSARTLELDAELQLRGRVIEAAGRPIAGAKVLLMPPDSGTAVQAAPRSAVTDGEGAFRVTGLFGGVWTAVASAGGWVDSPEQSVELSSGRVTAPLSFQMQRGGYLAGSVRSGSGGAPPPGLRVSIVEPSGKAVRVAVGSSFGSDTASSIGVDGDGRWTCTRVLAPGEYRVSLVRSASAGGADGERVLNTTTVQVVAGETLSVPLTFDG